MIVRSLHDSVPESLRLDLRAGRCELEFTGVHSTIPGESPPTAIRLSVHGVRRLDLFEADQLDTVSTMDASRGGRPVDLADLSSDPTPIDELSVLYMPHALLELRGSDAFVEICPSSAPTVTGASLVRASPVTLSWRDWTQSTLRSVFVDFARPSIECVFESSVHQVGRPAEWRVRSEPARRLTLLRLTREGRVCFVPDWLVTPPLTSLDEREVVVRPVPPWSEVEFASEGAGLLRWVALSTVLECTRTWDRDDGNADGGSGPTAAAGRTR